MFRDFGRTGFRFSDVTLRRTTLGAKLSRKKERADGTTFDKMEIHGPQKVVKHNIQLGSVFELSLKMDRHNWSDLNVDFPRFVQ